MNNPIIFTIIKKVPKSQFRNSNFTQPMLIRLKTGCNKNRINVHSFKSMLTEIFFNINTKI